MISRASVREFALYLTVALAVVGAAFCLFYNHPVAFVYLIAEDFHGEYTTSAAFAAASLLFGQDAWSARRRSRRVISAAMALAALLIAGEEVSWGHRFWYSALGFAEPEVLLTYNLQGELNLHNLESLGLSAHTYRMGAGALLSWLVLSAWLLWLHPALADRLDAAGVPLVPPRLAPLFVAPPLLFLFEPIAKSDEVGELVLGIAAAAFALDRASRAGWLAGSRLPALPQAFALCLAAIGVVGFALATVSPLRIMSARLHSLATRDYPRFGMYEQAETLFAFVDRHHDALERPDTQLAHAEMLVAAGRLDEARAPLAAAVEQARADPAALGGDGLCRMGQLYASLGEPEAAEAAFSTALVVDQHLLPKAATADERAELMWSLARTLRAQGLQDEARTTADRAEATASSARLRRELRLWSHELEKADGVAPVSTRAGAAAGTPGRPS